MSKFDLMSAISLLSRFGSAAGKGAIVGAVGGAVVEAAAPAAINALLMRAIKKGGCTPLKSSMANGRVVAVQATTKSGAALAIDVLSTGYSVDHDGGTSTAPSLSALTAALAVIP